MIKLPQLAIDNHQFTLIVFLLLFLMGIGAVITMPRTEDPPMDIPGASVVVIYPGSNPLDLEDLIANPIEESLNELEDIKVINSNIKDGVVTISIEFTFETDADEKFDQVVRQVNSIKSDLPQDIYDLQVFQWSSTDVLMLQMAFVSETAGYERMNRGAEDLKKKLERIGGVRAVEILAYPESELRVSMDLEKMAAMNISIDRVEQAIRSNNANIPGGEIRIGRRSFNVRTSGAFKDPDELKNTVVSSYMGSLVYLKDIAQISFMSEDQKYFARVNGINCIYLTVKQKEGLNIFTLKNEVDPVMENFRKNLDPDIDLITVFDQAESVDTRINGFFSSLIQGIVLVGIFVFLSLGVRASLLVIIAIPLSILVGLGWVDIWGFGLQQISIAALVIALGLLVDNSIVITENIERFIRNGVPKKQAAGEAAAQLGWPIVAATVTTMFAFIPIIMMPDKAGRFIQSLPVTVILTLFASLLIALTLTPYLASRFLKRSNRQKGEHGFKKILRQLIEGPYRKSLHFALKKTWLVIILSLFLLGGTFVLFTYIGVSFFPKAEKPQFFIRVSVPEGSSIEYTDTVSRYVESVLDTLQEVKIYASNIGHGNPRIYYNTFPKQYEKHYAEIYCELYEYDAETFANTIEKLREFFSNYSGARINIKELEQGAPIEAPLTIKITGQDLDRLRKISFDVQRWVESTPGLVNIDNNLSRINADLWFHINREKAGLYGVPVHMIDRTIRMAIAGSAVSSYRDKNGENYDIVLRLPVKEKASISDLNKIYVSSLTGEMIPLNQLGRLEFHEAPGIISHYNLLRDATITADIKKGYILDNIVEELRPRLEQYEWPDGYDYKFAGELESRQESFGGMRRASLIALIAILAVLVLQFRSFRQPLIIFSAIPLALVGSTLALYITGYTFSFTAFIGLISLIGIVVNNSIILVDFTNILRKKGATIDAALSEAGEVRFIPIVLTTLTTIGGLLPLTLQGGTLWAPMGWTIIGGLLVSTVLTLIVVPVLYKIFEKPGKLI